MSQEFENDFSIESILRETLFHFKKLFSTYLFIYLIFVLALSLFSILTGGNEQVEVNNFAKVIEYLALFIFSTLLSGILTAATWSYLNGQENYIKLGLTRCFEVITPLFSASFISIIFIAIGLILFIIPGVMIGLALALVTPIVIVENPGISESLKRSRDLTDGYKLSIFLLLLATMFMAILPAFIMALLENVFGISLINFMVPVVQAFLTIFNMIMYVVIYRRLSAQG